MKHKKRPGISVVKGARIDLNSPDVRKAKDVSDLKALDIFSHLTDSDQEEAYNELWNDLTSKEVAKEEDAPEPEPNPED